MQKTSLDMTQGDVLGGLLAFSVPALIGNLLQRRIIFPIVFTCILPILQKQFHPRIILMAF